MHKRAIFKVVQDHLKKDQITLLIGASQVGKTTLLKQLYDESRQPGQNSYYISFDDPQYLNLLNEHPDKLFDILPPLNDNKRTLLFIDEIQRLKEPSTFLKYHHDAHKQILKLIVTGSTEFYMDENYSDSLAGRKKIFYLGTLSFAEFMQFQNREELAQQIHLGALPLIYKTELQRKFNEYLIYGGYPDVVMESDLHEKQALLKELQRTIMNRVSTEAKLRFPDKYLKLLKHIALHPGLFNANAVGENLKLDRLTIQTYLQHIRKSFHISQLSPFSQKSAKELRKMPTLYFNDLGLRNVLANNFSALALREDRGDLLKHFVFRIFLDHYPLEDIKFWRTQKGQDVDFIISEKRAFGINYSSATNTHMKYIYFTTMYPDIPITLIHKENILELAI